MDECISKEWAALRVRLPLASVGERCLPTSRSVWIDPTIPTDAQYPSHHLHLPHAHTRLTMHSHTPTHIDQLDMASARRAAPAGAQAFATAVASTTSASTTAAAAAVSEPAGGGGGGPVASVLASMRRRLEQRAATGKLRRLPEPVSQASDAWIGIGCCDPLSVKSIGSIRSTP